MSEQQKKIEKLQSLKNEVKDFHPLLHDLFNKITDIASVEYHQGPNEKGADFILTRFDSTLAMTQYIGVIVKVGKTNSSQVKEIENQIDYCINTSRAVSQGAVNTNLNQVWVVSNDSLSNHAQERIHDNYGKTNVLFIDNTRVIKWIDIYFPSYWDDIPHEVSLYFNRVLEKSEKLDFHSSLNIDTNDFYVDQEIHVFDNEGYKLNRFRKKSKLRKRKRLNSELFLEEIESNNFILLEGHMGSGKSKLVRHALKHYTDPLVYSSKNILPLYESFMVFYRDFDCNLESLISHNLTAALLEQYQEKKCELLIFIDGFDELDVDDHEIQSDLINKIENQTNGEAKVVLTSRNIGFLANPAVTVTAPSKRYQLAPLSVQKTIQFIENICKEIQVTSNLINDIQKSSLFKQISNNPISALLLARLLESNSQDIPSNITELYSQYIELSLGRWDIDKGLKITNQEFEASENILQNLAFYMIENNLFDLDEVQCFNFFEKYLDERNLEIKPKTLYEKIVKRSNIVYKDKFTNRIVFTHRSFAEYFYAKKVQKNGDGEKLLQKAFDFYWTDTVFFYIGLLKDCEDILNHLLNREDVSMGQKLIKLIAMSEYLLAGFSSPYKVVKEGLPYLFVLGAKAYIDIINGKVTSDVLTKLSQVQLLGLFQYLIRTSYSYTHFFNALDSIWAKIDELDEDEEVKAYAMFFVGVIGLEFDFDEPMNQLLEKYSLPIPLQIATRHEAKNVKHLSKEAEKRLKKLKKHINDKDIKAFVDTAYSKPIEEFKLEHKTQPQQSASN